MKSKFLTPFLLLTLTIIFTIGLTFASIELPKVTDDLIHDKMSFVNVYTGGGDLQELKTELFIQHFHLRTIGYICLFAIVFLIILGFITEKSGLTSLGAFAIFLPVFGHFAATMFFLGGLGFLRLIWLPGLDISFDIMKLGDAVFIPYRIILDIFNLIGINLYSVLPYIFIVSGLLIFCIGTLIWFNTYFKKEGLATKWIYKVSRHPQYLGWIVWSYGILFLPGVNMKQSYSISDSLPWLISTIVIIGIAMLEEIKMSKKYGIEYDNYRRNSYFMIPFPKYICRTVSAPFKVLFKKNYPTTKKEIAYVLLFYFSLIILITITLNSTAKMTTPGKWVFESQETRSTKQLASLFLNSPERRDKYKYSVALLEKGDSSISYFIDYLNHPDFVIREFSADALGKYKSENAIDPLIKALDDNNGRVVNSVVRSLGNYKTESVTNALISSIDTNNIPLTSAIISTLASIGSENAIKAIIPLVQTKLVEPNTNLVLALSNSNSENAEDLIIEFISNNDAKIRQAAVIAALRFNSDKIRTALTKALDDEDWEVRLYTEEVLKQISK